MNRLLDYFKTDAVEVFHLYCQLAGQSMFLMVMLSFFTADRQKADYIPIHYSAWASLLLFSIPRSVFSYLHDVLLDPHTLNQFCWVQYTTTAHPSIQNLVHLDHFHVDLKHIHFHSEHI